MNKIAQQQRIIDQIYRLLLDSLDTNFEAARCEIGYSLSEDGSSSISSRLSFDVAGTTKHGLLKYPDRRVLDTAVPELHSLMKAHTGGDWEAFTLTIDKDGRVTTKFEYPEQT